MIPPFDDNGYLPPGIHLASLEEIERRFGRESELRQVQFESLKWLVGIAGRAGVSRIVINGSFTTEVFEPNDIDCALLLGPDFPLDPHAEAELDAGLPFLDLHLMTQVDFDLLTQKFFATDRNSIPKGLVEVQL